MSESGPIKVMLLDDEQDILQFFIKTFQNFHSIEFFSASRPSEGLVIARREKPQVIMLDLQMPEMNGEEVMAALRKDLPETKFIVMTGWEDGATRERVENQPQVAAFFPKPVDLEKVVTKVISLVMVKNT